jgi:hypothetical protein
MEGHSSRIEKTEDRISEVEDKRAIKGKTEELLVKLLKTCEKKMQKLTDSIKKPNLRIMGIEGEEVQAKGMCREIPRWRLEGRSRKQASYSEILERCWRHTLQA